MYIPPVNIMEDRQEAIAFMQRYSFATLINTINGRPHATHLPFVIREEKTEILLLAHFAKANAQWQALETTEALVVFTEPHAYVSPRHYDKELSVPTWNYAAVHVYGKAEIVKDEEQGMTMLEEMINSYEPAYQAQWKGLPDAYKTAMYNGIVPFVIKVTELEAKAKLSQNKKPEEQERIANELLNSEQGVERVIGEMMKK